MANFTITVASVIFSGATGSSKGRGTAGESVTPGMPVYLKASDNRLWKADANVTEAEATVVGIALSVSAAGQPLFYAIADPEFQHGTDAGVNTPIFLASTAGALMPVDDFSVGDFPNCLMLVYGDDVAYAALNCGGLFTPEAIT